MIELKESQIEAVRRLKKGNILAGGTGFGKTRTSLAYYYIYCQGDYRAFNSDRYFPMKDPIDLYVITTAKNRDDKSWESEMVPFLIGSELYSTKVVVDSWNNIKKYIKVRDSFFIFDEQRVGGKGDWSKAFLKIASANHWILLSATPGDRWEDYANIFVANGFYKNISEFNRMHLVYKPYLSFPVVDRYVGTKRLEALRSYILVWTEENRKTRQIHKDIAVNYDMTAYKSVVRNRTNPYRDNEPILNASQYCYILRRVCNEDNSRIQAVEKLAKQKKKVIIFYNFDYELEILRRIDYGKGFMVAEWNGHRHDPLPKTTKWVYLVQYTAGCEGWNCITTDTIIFYSQNYSHKVLIQASGRIDRTNTPFEELYYYHLVSGAPIDRAIRRALKEKATFHESSFVRGIGFGSSPRKKQTS